MTIHRDWIAAWKADDRSAFTPLKQGSFQTVFIDGQIKLMKSSHIKTWKDYMDCQFAWSIRNYFQGSVSTVVLAFDNYDYVPASKGMTQMKRRKHLPQVNEDEQTPLPPFIPDNWDAAIMNRTFKTKVIHLICEKLPELLRIPQGKRLIIDYQGPPVVYDSAGISRIESMAPLGEADVKFTRYAHMGRMMIEATDGDYLPIALIHLERRLVESRENDPRPLPDMVIYRMECKLDPPKKTGGKDGPPERNHKRPYEYVCISKLYDGIRRKISRAVSLQRGGGTSSSSGHEMRILAGLITLTGCDFTKGLPQISPKRIWDNVSLIWKRLEEVYDPASESFHAQMLADLVVAKLYTVIYSRHVCGDRIPMHELAKRLKEHSTLSVSTKSKLPHLENVLCISRNANWVIAYWKCPSDGEYPSPMQERYGFAYNKKGLPQWADDIGG